MFKELDCVVSTTVNATNAVQIFTNYIQLGHPFHLVFLDYRLTGTNGIAVARLLQGIDPAIKLMLFDSPLLKNNQIRQEYCNLFGFFREPIISYDQIEATVNRKKRKLQKSLKKITRRV